MLLRTLLGIGLGKRLPIVEGSLQVSGLRDTTIIRRDEHGIPYIDAQNDDDAFFGLGFCQAQDRAFQIELYMRLTRGTLSEIVGPDALPVDRLARRLGFPQYARAQLAASNDATRAQFTSFARGVNAALTRGGKQCHEMTLLGAEHTTFEAHDPAAVLAFFSFALSSNWDAELARLRVLREDGRDALLALEPSLAAFQSELFAAIDVLETADALVSGVSAMREMGAVGAASNAWAIGPSRTATGRPIVAGDPHLSPTLPAPWYLAHVRTPEWGMTGACLVPQPVVSIGHNDRVAWAVTAGHVDNTDLFVEHVGKDGRSVRDGDRFVPCETRREIIKVKGKPDEILDVLVTPRGPIVGDVLGPSRDALSINGTWMSKTRTLRAYQAHRARNVEEAQEIFDGYPGPSESRVFADVGGDIAWQVHGDIPVRKSGHGLVPAPGWNPAYGWKEERLPFAKHPRGKNPERGFVATANQCPPEIPDGVFCGVDWLDRHRYDRIVEKLGAKSDWTIDDVLEMHLDRRSTLTRELLPLFVAAATDPIAKKWLEPWDGELAPSSVAASIFELAFAELARRIAQRHAPKAWRTALGEGINDVLAHGPNAIRRIGELTRLVRALPAREIDDALAFAVRDLRAKFGPRDGSWQWGKVRPLRLRHAFAKQPPLDRVFALRDVAIGGDATTIPQGSIDFHDPLGDPIGVPNMRAAIDVGAWENSRWSLLGGQSGNPCSAHFGDLLEHWDRGEGVAIAWSKEDVERCAKTVLRLES